MQKIMFNDKYNLTQAVLEGRKTQTRRIIKTSDAFERVNPDFDWDEEDIKNWNNSFALTVQNMSEEEKKNCFDYLLGHPKYKVGEVVAVAQSYETISNAISKTESKEKAVFYCKVMKACFPNAITHKDKEEIAGWYNKMFVRGDLMPNQIRINDVRIERLQDISDEDCIKEGVHEATRDFPWYWIDGFNVTFNESRAAFAHLINKVSKKDVWQENPYVFVYDFEQVK